MFEVHSIRRLGKHRWRCHQQLRNCGRSLARSVKRRRLSGSAETIRRFFTAARMVYLRSFLAFGKISTALSLGKAERSPETRTKNPRRAEPRDSGKQLSWKRQGMITIVNPQISLPRSSLWLACLRSAKSMRSLAPHSVIKNQGIETPRLLLLLRTAVASPKSNCSPALLRHPSQWGDMLRQDHWKRE